MNKLLLGCLVTNLALAAAPDLAKTTMQACMARQVSMNEGKSRHEMKQTCKQMMKEVDHAGVTDHAARPERPAPMSDPAQPLIPLESPASH